MNGVCDRYGFFFESLLLNSLRFHNDMYLTKVVFVQYKILIHNKLTIKTPNNRGKPRQ